MGTLSASDVARLEAIGREMDKLSKYPTLTRTQQARFDALAAEFDAIDSPEVRAERERARHAAILEGLRDGTLGGTAGDGSGRNPFRASSHPRTRRTDGTSETRGRAFDRLDEVERTAEHLSRVQLDHIARAVDSDDLDVMARYVRAAADPAYLSAFRKLVRDPQTGAQEFTDAERAAFTEARMVQRAMSLTDNAGGYMVPFTLDPAVVLSNTGTSNTSLRSAFTVRTIATDTWNGVTSAGVTASWDAEAAEVSDDSPTLAGPSIKAEKGSAFIPFSIEVGQDAANFAAEAAKMLGDAKERLEAAAFITGAGSGSDQPNGIITAAVAASKTQASAGADAFAVADLYATKKALPARWRADAAWLANENIYDEVRQFATGTGPQSAFWADLGDGRPPLLLGKPAWESSEVDGTYGTGDNYVMVYGDLSQYYVVDRVGTTIELVPHLFGANRRPTGQRGFYMYFRTGGDLVVTDSVRVLNVT